MALGAGATLNPGGRIDIVDAPPVGFSNGLPFDAQGNICIGAGVVAYHSNALPYLADGRLAGASGPVVHFDQGVPYTTGGHLAIDLIGPITLFAAGYPLTDIQAFATAIGGAPPANAFTNGFSQGFD